MLVTMLAVMGVTQLGAAKPAFAADCNNNGIEDATDIASETSLDCNNDGIPDECQSVVVDEDFNGYSPNDDPADWFSTDTGSSTNELTSGDRFRVEQVGSDLTLGTYNSFPNIHSHFVGAGATNISSMTYTGRMRISNSDGGIGVTFLSQFSDQPTSTYEYVRIRRANYAPSAQTFHLAPPNVDNFVGVKDSGVNPNVNTWYRFRIVVDTSGSQLHVQANIWEEGQPEPAGFQIDAVDTSGQQPTSGTLGVWSMGTGGKFWDDLEVTAAGGGTPCDDGDLCTTCDSMTGGTCTGIPVDCSHLDDGCLVGVCNQSNGECETAPAGDGACDDLNPCTENDTCTGGVCAGTPVDCSGVSGSCLPGVCNPATGLCEAPPESTDCNMNNVPDDCELLSSLSDSKFTAPDGAAGDRFGAHVELYGTTAVVSAFFGSVSGISESGSAYVIQNVGGPGELVTELTYDEPTTGDYFGYSTSLSGDTLVVGANRDDDDGIDSGSAFVFTLSNGAWQQVAKLTADDAASDDLFGSSVAIDGDFIVIGAYGDDSGGSSSGAAYAFEKINGVWTQIDKLTANDASSNDLFGRSLALSGDTVVIGAYQAEKTGTGATGAAYVFRRIGGMWQQIAKLTANDAASGDGFGVDVAIDGDTIVVGAFQDHEGAADSGAAFVFREIGGVWQQIAKLTSGDPVENANFGRGVDIEGQRIVVGAYRDNASGFESGTVYLWEESEGTWQGPVEYTPTETAAGDRFGFAIAIYGNRSIVGAFLDDDKGADSGSAFLLTFAADDCNSNGVLDECDLASGQVSDCNLNGIPDICEPFGENSQDCSHLDDACVSGVCNLGTGTCETVPANEGEACDDSDPCTTEDSCSDGACVGIQKDCSHLDNSCIPASCNSATGSCETPTEAADCNANGVPDECEFTLDPQRRNMIAPDGSGGNEFGYSLDFGEHFGIIGAPKGWDEVFRSGSAYIFKETGGVWQYSMEISADDAADGDRFGHSVSISGNTIVVGANRADELGVDSGAAYVFNNINGTWQQSAKLTAADGTISDYFGSDVALSGDTILIGAYGNDDEGLQSGSAYIYRKTNGVWQQTAKLSANDAAPNEFFGRSVALYEGTAVIGAHGSVGDEANSSGSAYVFREIDGTWQQIAKLKAGDATFGDGFGHDVAIHGDTIVVGAHVKESAYVFRETENTWTPIAKLRPTDISWGAHLGFSVAINGSRIALGGPDNNDDGVESGTVYLSNRIGDVWQQPTRITSFYSDARDHLGASVALNGSTAFAGSYGAAVSGSTRGRVQSQSYEFPDCNNNEVFDACDIESGVEADCNLNYMPDSCELFNVPEVGTIKDDRDQVSETHYGRYVDLGASVAIRNRTILSGDAESTSTVAIVGDPEYRLPEFCEETCGLEPDPCHIECVGGEPVGLAQIWEQFNGIWFSVSIITGDAVIDEGFGTSVDASDNTLVVGAPGSNSVYFFEGYYYLSRVARFSTGTGDFGRAVAVDGTTALIGAPLDPLGVANAGAVYVYEKSNGAWQQKAILTANDAQSDAHFGASISINGNVAIIGAYGDSGNGAAYVFANINGNWQQTAKLAANDAAAGDYFGYSVGVSDTTAIVGAFLDDDAGASTGAAYIFRKINGTWQQTAKIKANDADGGAQFGFSVALQGKYAIVGARYDDTLGPDSGASYMFREAGGVWTQIKKLTGSDTNNSDRFGTSAAIDEGYAIFGAVGAGYHINGDDDGGAYVFQIVDFDCNDNEVPDECDTGDQANPDCNVNGIADGCEIEILDIDCNFNGIPDDCDLEGGDSPDCNLNGIPDECEAYGENSLDCSHLDDNCSLGICNLETGLCETITANDGTACDDLNPCTEIDICASGECMGTIRDCSEYDIECLPASCNSDTGLCESPEIASDCNLNDIPDECEISLGFGYSKFVAPDGGADDLFGLSIDVEGPLAIIGAPDASPAGVAKAGSAYVLENVDGNWQHAQQLIANDGTTDDRFGYCVAISGGSMVVGANRDDQHGFASGSAYVFASTNGMWSQTAKLLPNDPANLDYFGTGAAIRGDTILIGAHKDRDFGTDSGSVYVFRKVNGVWQPIDKLNPDDASSGHFFGRNIAISGDTAVIGAHGASKTGVSNCGAAYVFREVGGVWQQIAKLTAGDAASGDEFGLDVAIDGSNIVVGANRDDDGAIDSGSAYMFREIEGVWQQVAKLSASDYSEDARFGYTVEIHGNRAIFGAIGDSQNGTESGAAYISRSVKGSWQPPVKFTPDYAEANDRLGISVAISEDTAFAGAYFDDDNGSNSGSVYVFSVESSDCNNNGIPDDCDIADGTSSDCNTNGIPDSCEYAPIIASPSASECPGTVVTLDAGLGYESYLWEPGGEITQTVQVTSPGIYRVVVTGCSGASSVARTISVAFNGNQPGSTAALVSSKLTNSIVAIDTQSGKVLFDFAPSGKDGLNDPNGITVDDAGHVYVSSVNTSSVKKFAAFTGELIQEYTGSLTAPVGVLVADSNTLLVSNWTDDSVHMFDIVTGQALGQLVASGAGGLDGPTDMLLTPSGELLVSSQSNHQVLAFDAATGAFNHVAAQGSGLATPAGLLLDPQGNLLVASFNSDQVLRFDPATGAFIDVFVGNDPGTPGTDESGGLNGPEGIEWGANGNLLVNNRYGSNVLEYDGTTGAFVRALGAEGLNQPTYLAMTTLDPDCNADRIPDYCASDTGLAGMDCNFNGIGDQCDDASHGDFDANGVLDIIDFGYLADCQAGPNAAPSPANGSCTSMCLQAFDADNDGDIDLKDFASFTLQP
ncbi:MAG: hypothetical protein R3E58_03865 [Phycisphaerae bacterium]